MRKQFCDAMVARAARPDLMFLTGDLGFMALEPLQAALGSRFINAGVAEQNMVSVAAALAREGLETWAYSIAPFIYARPFEQIRNDVSFHGLPVKLVGNGGGYGYGVMGPTHHAIEDYGTLLALPGMAVYVPVFDEDLAAVVDRVGNEQRPSYLRIGRGEPPKGWTPPAYAPWRRLVQGRGAVVIAVGPLAGTYVAALQALDESRRPDLWALAELPVALPSVPADILSALAGGRRLCIAEEHVAQGGVASQLLLALAGAGLGVAGLTHLHARAHHYERYGSQAWLRRQSGLDPDGLLAALDLA
ncbi:MULTISPECIES: transketolase [Ramlibacter]|uniref:Transketolase n=1 Tax=Ramlibacter pinisoli TaxID=2682844 RepID=A0A6N8IUY8_9BURK|nr:MULTISPECIES: transketolase [Ramlibacter]MBA2964841.1 transketolase [Ramlibacter sp. CGMCC 1.13660]MVQ29806.1 transketolase [Ramlibacter pinisoli]